MNPVVRNLVIFTTSTALVGGGLFAVITRPPGPSTGTPGPVPGSQLATGNPNGVAPPIVNTTPSTPSSEFGGIGPFNANLQPQFPANYASDSATMLQTFIDTQRLAAGVPQLAYDAALGQVAANLIIDTISTGRGFPSMGINSLNQTPIQQVLAQFPGSPVTYVSAVTIIADVTNDNEVLDPIAGLNYPSLILQTDSNQTMINPGWTHYGIAVETIPAVQGVSTARRYYVVFFAKEG